MYYLLSYDFVADYSVKREEHRKVHIAHAQAAQARGELVLAGVLEPLDGALLVFRADSEAVAERFAREDPYVENGLVTGWRVRGWSPVLGTLEPLLSALGEGRREDAAAALAAL